MPLSAAQIAALVVPGNFPVNPGLFGLGLTTAQFALMSTMQMSNLTTAEIQEISTAEIAALTTLLRTALMRCW